MKESYPYELDQLLMEKPFAALDARERAFVLTQVDDENMYEEMRAVLLALVVELREEAPTLPAASKERVMAAFRAEHAPAPWWKSGLFAPSYRPYLAWAAASVLLLVGIFLWLEQPEQASVAEEPRTEKQSAPAAKMEVLEEGFGEVVTDDVMEPVDELEEMEHIAIPEVEEIEMMEYEEVLADVSQDDFEEDVAVPAIPAVPEVAEMMVEADSFVATEEYEMVERAEVVKQKDDLAALSMSKSAAPRAVSSLHDSAPHPPAPVNPTLINILFTAR